MFFAISKTSRYIGIKKFFALGDKNITTEMKMMAKVNVLYNQRARE